MSAVAIKLVNTLKKAKDRGFTVNVVHDDKIINVAFEVDGFIAEQKECADLEAVTKFIEDCLWLYEVV